MPTGPPRGNGTVLRSTPSTRATMAHSLLRMMMGCSGSLADVVGCWRDAVQMVVTAGGPRRSGEASCAGSG
eukprot:11161206-Lingulodinium_polyedra.AAC.1